MISFNLTALTRETPLIQRKAKTCTNFSRKTFQTLTQFSFKASTFNSICRFSPKKSPQTTALQYFKKKAMAEMNPQFAIDEDQEMETQPFTYPVMRVKSTHFPHHRLCSYRTTSLIRTVPSPN